VAGLSKLAPSSLNALTRWLCCALTAILATGCGKYGYKASAQSPQSSQITTFPQIVDAAESRETLREEIYRRARDRNGGKEPTKLQLFNELARKAYEESGAEKGYGKPRIVAPGGRPEIAVQDAKVVVDGTSLIIGKSTITDWRLALGPESRKKVGTYVIYIWDQLGVSLSTDRNHRIVSQLLVVLNREPKAPWNPKMPDSSVVAEPNDLSPKNSFPGYLQLDGFGIDANTEFWEIRASVDPERNLRCGLRDCSHPHGAFSEGANIYLRLDSTSENGRLYEFIIAGD